MLDPLMSAQNMLSDALGAKMHPIQAFGEAVKAAEKCAIQTIYTRIRKTSLMPFKVSNFLFFSCDNIFPNIFSLPIYHLSFFYTFLQLCKTIGGYSCDLISRRNLNIRILEHMQLAYG